VLDRVLNALESRRLPMVISLAVSAALAAFTALRFVVLIHAMPPAQYGVFNLYTLLASLLPLFMTAGLTLQYQRVSHFQGPGTTHALLRTSVLVTLIALVPSFAAVFLITMPIVSLPELIWVSIFLLVISATASLTTFHSQILLGLNYRSTSSLMMFLVNAGATFAVLPAWLEGRIAPMALLGWWAAFSVAITALTWWVARSRREGREGIGGVLSWREGLLSVPSQIGPWLFVFVIRYLIGLNIDESAIANYAIAATISDMAFLVAVSLLNYFTNRVMSGTQAPWRGILLSAPLYLLLAACGFFAVLWLLPLVGQQGYELEPPVALILIGVGLVRLYLTAWRSRALGLKKIHVSSNAYLVVIAISVLALWFWAPVYPEAYAVVTLAGFLVVAVVQRISLSPSAGRRARRSRP